MTNPTSTSIHQNVIPSEVGWQFVPQYYTFVNKEPHRLHCFYTKTSTFMHGTEGEEGKACYGQQEIHARITEIGFQDCKVFIHSVDAQSSANGGIIIQVIGEMSNNGEPWRKFVQTFFLAEQPNGYFVLNDIFRFLKEETVDSDEASEVAEPESAPAHPAEPAPAPIVLATEPVYEAPRPPTPPTVAPPQPPAPPVEDEPTNDVPEPPAVVKPPTPAPAPEPAPQAAPAAAPPAAPQPNGVHTPEPQKIALPPPAEKSSAPSPAPSAPAAPSPAPSASAALPAQQPQQPPSAPVAAPVPQAPRSWASLAATNSKKWGATVAQEGRGVSETPASTQPAQPPTPVNRAPQQQQQQQQPHPLYIAAQSITTPQCFIKGVLDVISNQALSSQLSQFGPIKELEIIRNKACAFLEFQNLDSAKRAIVASLSHNQGGGGGVFIEVGGEIDRLRIVVETKKERGDRPPARGRGGGPGQGDRDGKSPINGNGEGRGQGGYRARGGGRGGRGAGPK